MVERSDEPRLNTPIVPDPSDELAERHRPVSAGRPLTWPLWLLCVLLLAGLGGLAGIYWLDRQAWQANQRDLEGQLSNLHARFDSLDDRYEIAAEVSKKIETLNSAQQTIRERQEALAAELQKVENRSVDGSNLNELAQRFDTAEEERDTLAATIEAMQRSLDVLETSGEDARAALQSRIQSLESAQDETGRQLQALNELGSRVDDLSESQQQLQSRVTELADLEARLSELASSLETLRSSVEEREARLEQLTSRIESNQAGLIELRQSLLALSANVENLNSRIGQVQGTAISPQQLKELEERMESLETSRQQLTGRVASLLSDIGNLQRQL